MQNFNTSLDPKKGNPLIIRIRHDDQCQRQSISEDNHFQSQQGLFYSRISAIVQTAQGNQEKTEKRSQPFNSLQYEIIKIWFKEKLESCKADFHKEMAKQLTKLNEKFSGN